MLFPGKVYKCPLRGLIHWLVWDHSPNTQWQHRFPFAGRGALMPSHGVIAAAGVHRSASLKIGAQAGEPEQR